MKKAYWMLFALSLGLGACADGGSEADTLESNENSELGNIALNLTGTDSSGRTYRLRDATFDVWGYPDFPVFTDGGFGGYSTSVSTETDPNAPVITLRVVPGYYQVYFSSQAWYLERLVGSAWERVEQAVLLSSTSQSVYVYNQGVSPVAFRFGVDGELIDFRAGDLTINIEIEQPGDGPGDAGFPGGGLTGGFFGGFGGVAGGSTVGGIAGGGVTGGGPGGIEFDAGAGVLVP